jgi:hypothetical protein
MDLDKRKTDAGDNRRDWYFNSVTGKAELGKLSPIGQRVGPYQSRKDAEDAWKIAHERNLIWDEQNRKWDTWDNDDGPDADLRHLKTE